MKKITGYFRTRFNALRADESGMEAAQVILILAIVIIALIPIIKTVVSKVSTNGNNVNSCLGGGSCAP